MRNEENIDKIYDLGVLTFLLNSSIYRLIMAYSLGRRLKNNVVRWFNEMNTLTVTERVNFIFDNKYEEGILRIWFSISNIFVFLRSRFYEKSKFLKKREERNQTLKDKIIFVISFEEQTNIQTFYFTRIFLKNILTRVGFFASRIFLYAYFIFAIIFRMWSKAIFTLLSFLVLCKVLYKFNIKVRLKKIIIVSMVIVIILSIL